MPELTEPSGPAAGGLPGGNLPPPTHQLPHRDGTPRYEERRWGMSCHLAALLVWLASGFFGWVPPLVIMHVRGRNSAFVRQQAAESLNFQLTLISTTVALAGLAVLGVLTSGGAFFGFFLVMAVLFSASLAVTIAAVVFMIQGSIRANRGRPYHYPVNLRIVR